MSKNECKEEKNTLSTVVYDGFVKRDFGNFVLIELETPEGTKDINIGLEDCVDRKLPELGRAIRYRLTLEYAPDLESEMTDEEKRDSDNILETGRSNNSQSNPGHYTLG